MNPRDAMETAYDWLGASSISLPCALDTDETIYRSYGDGDNFAPFPLHVVLDGDGVITYLAWQYDHDALTTALDAALGLE